MRIKSFNDPAALASIDRPASMVSAVGNAPFAENPDVHLVAFDKPGQALGCCSLWFSSTPKLAGESIGYIGHYYSVDEAVSDELLSAAERRLAEASCAVAVGPMNGNTWRKYRFVTWSSGEPPVLLEPTNPEEWPVYWTNHGFAPLAGYHSSVIEDLALADERIARAEERLVSNGIRIRTLDPERFIEELKRIYAISASSFVSNFLYTPISETEFLALYQPTRRFVNPQFCLLAALADEPVGFVFSLPDLNQTARGQTLDTLIIKTLAVLPHRQNAGLGAVLVDRMRRAALEAGMKRVVHALMFDQNNSANIGKDRSRVFRRYTLFSKRLSR